MKISLIICAILGLFHLAMVSLGAAQLDFRTWKWADLGIAYYGAFSGADTGYSFFVPGAGPQFRAYFEIVEAEKTFSDSLEKGKSQ